MQFQLTSTNCSFGGEGGCGISVDEGKLSVRHIISMYSKLVLTRNKIEESVF